MFARTPRLLCGLLALSGLGTAPAFAQTTPVQLPRVTSDVVVTATAAPVSGAAVGRTVAVLTREDLERLGVSSIIEGLRLFPGVDPKARGGQDVQTDFSLRGATFGQALVLIDGVRLNDTQSGHHNGEIPAALLGIDRIEVVFGPASSVHGADAMGGTIQVITRTDRHATALLSVGDHATVTAQGSASGGPLPSGWVLSGWGARSDGFMFDRDFASGGGALRGAIKRSLTISASHQRRVFGANGFYGNSPSKEWTDQSIGSVQWAQHGQAWTTNIRIAARNHGDHFRWDIARPGFAENRHRTDALDASLSATRTFTPQLQMTAGGGAGGDWISSSNLGDHTYSRGHGFVETQWTPAARLSAQVGVRLDGYSTFGHAWSPSASVAAWLSPSVRLRASAARAFRIPSFTERFYTDPAHQASAQLDPERGSAVDAGLDVISRGWTFALSPFIRWDDAVIDWIRNTPAERWRTTNVRDVTTRGVEVSASRQVGSALLRAHYAGLSVDAPSLTTLSKYVLEFARHTVGVSTAVPVVAGVRMAINADFRSRVDGQQYWLVGGRLSRTVGRLDLHVEGSNLLDESYREVAGVPMPGRWISVGVRVR
jgi:iron complex outermembrane receptor protein